MRILMNNGWRSATGAAEQILFKKRRKMMWFLCCSFYSSSNSNAYSNGPIIISPPLVSIDLLDDTWPCLSTSFTSSDSLKTKIVGSATAASVLDGKVIAEDIRSRIAMEVRHMKESLGKVPGLAVILVGQRRDSETYVRNKMIACEEVGIKFVLTELPECCTTEEVCNAMCRFNKNPSIHGILVQLPLPKHLNEGRILDEVCLEKDVDGFHPLNVGNLALRGNEPLFIPCTPKGCIELLLRYNVEVMGKHAVVIGRSNIVGLPLSLLLQRHHATVSIIHAFTNNPEKIAREADILVAAAGVPNLVHSSWLKPGVVIVDIGTNPIEDPNEEYGYRLVGDVCYEEASSVASAVTPVPGGVGPMTVAMLLLNTLESAKRAFKFT